MTLREAQSKFARDVAKLIERATSLGYDVAFGWAYRPPEFAQIYEKLKIGVARSIHELKLGVDLDLFINGVYQEMTEAHQPLGEYWESLDPENRWGGRFARPDGNHYSRRWGDRA